MTEDGGLRAEPDVSVVGGLAEAALLAQTYLARARANGGRRVITVTDQNEIIRRLRMWWDREYGIVVGERNQNIYVLAAAFNDFGVNKELATYVLGEFAHDGFPLSEIRTTIDSAYRKEMSKHHPDKLAAKGLPPEMMEMAKEKTQEIQQAWEWIREARGIR